MLSYHLMRRVHQNRLAVFQCQSIALLAVREPRATLELLSDLIIVLLLCSLPLHAIFNEHFALDSLGFSQLKARIDAIGVFAQADEAIMGLVE